MKRTTTKTKRSTTGVKRALAKLPNKLPPPTDEESKLLKALYRRIPLRRRLRKLIVGWQTVMTTAVRAQYTNKFKPDEYNFNRGALDMIKACIDDLEDQL